VDGDADIYGTLWCDDCWGGHDPAPLQHHNPIVCAICGVDEDEAYIDDESYEYGPLCEDCGSYQYVCAECGMDSDYWGLDFHPDADLDDPRVYCQCCIDVYDDAVLRHGGDDDWPDDDDREDPSGPTSGGPPGGGPPGGGPLAFDDEAQSNGARNARNKDKIKAAYPNHCAHHLYFAHRRGTPSRGCRFGDECRSGGHDAPAGLFGLELEPW
jgi:hypothetical protein